MEVNEYRMGDMRTKPKKRKRVWVLKMVAKRSVIASALVVSSLGY
jgi:hypothetical protein